MIRLPLVKVGTTRGEHADMRRPLKRPNWKNTAWVLFFLGPYLIGFVLFVGGPILGSLALSFTEWDIITPPKWIGLANFRRVILSDPQFIDATRNTLYYILLVVPSEIVLAFALALLLNSKLRAVNLFRAIYFMPFVLSLASIGLLWGWLYSKDLGLVSYVLQGLGISPPPFLGDIRWAMPSIALTTLWRNVGYYTVIFLAGLQTISVELYESASLDGANGLQRLRYITLPLISPTTFLIAIVAVIWGFQAFDLVYTMTAGGPGNSTLVLAYYLYHMGFRTFKMGRASAIGVVLFLVVMLITIIQFRMQKRWVHYERD